MTTCEVLQEKMVAGESLQDSEITHAQTCEDCSSFLATQQSLSSALRAWREELEPSPDEVSAIRARHADRIRPPKAWFRLAWASAALVLGVIATVAVLSGLWGQDDSSRADEQLLTLLDEVGDIAGPADEDAETVDQANGIYLAELLFEETDDQESATNGDLVLPDSYELLEEALGNSWL